LEKRNLNIGFDAKRYFQNKTGLGNYSHHIIDGLASLFPDLSIYLFTPRDEEVSDHQIISPHKSNLMAKIWRISGMVHEKSFKKLNIYHGLSNELPWRRTKVKTVVTIHNILSIDGFTTLKHKERVSWRPKLWRLVNTPKRIW
jgi:hypothetical protein